ncbi:MAG: hypothetical protein ACOYOJ_18480, partial [Alsobacter sp.]
MRLTARRIIACLDSAGRRQLGLLLLLSVGTALAEVVGVGSIVPFLTVLTVPESAAPGLPLGRLQAALGISAWRDFMLVLGAAAFAAFLVANLMNVAPFLPTWLAQIPMPLCMFLIALRFIMKAEGAFSRMLVVICAALILCVAYIPEAGRHLFLFPA